MDDCDPQSPHGLVTSPGDAIERNGQQAIIRLPLDGSPDEAVIGLGEDNLFDFGYSADGQSFAVTRGSWQHDVVLISDLSQH